MLQCMFKMSSVNCISGSQSLSPFRDLGWGPYPAHHLSHQECKLCTADCYLNDVWHCRKCQSFSAKFSTCLKSTLYWETLSTFCTVLFLLSWNCYCVLIFKSEWHFTNWVELSGKLLCKQWCHSLQRICEMRKGNWNSSLLRIVHLLKFL